MHPPMSLRTQLRKGNHTEMSVGADKRPDMAAGGPAGFIANAAAAAAAAFGKRGLILEEVAL